ncbi:MAG: hypothetical protein ACI9G6_003403, partial [Limisphaerales bacterium]
QEAWFIYFTSLRAKHYSSFQHFTVATQCLSG